VSANSMKGLSQDWRPIRREPAHHIYGSRVSVKLAWAGFTSGPTKLPRTRTWGLPDRRAGQPDDWTVRERPGCVRFLWPSTLPESHILRPVGESEPFNPSCN
jgi:hypothetical protein